MSWLLLIAACVFFGVLIFNLRRRYLLPWRNVEQILADVAKSQAPRTYLIEGSDEPRRVALALESIFDRQRDLSRRSSESEFSVQTILGAMSDGLMIVDKTGAIRLTNAMLRTMFDVAADITGATPLEALRSLEIEQAVRGALENEDTQRVEIGVGERRLEITATPLTDEQRETRGAVVLFRDITQLHQTETMRRDFVANVSHELRTPLSIVSGYLEELRDGGTSEAERARIFDVMQKHAQRLTLLVEDLLSLARLESPAARLEFADIDLATFLAAAMQEWTEPFARKQLSTALDVAPGLPPVRADELRLHEIIHNLLDNAVKYANSGGNIRVAAATRGGDFIELSVSDNGVGIPAADLPRVFERFYRVDKSRSRDVGGTGLGLSIVKHIAQLHGGHVEARSTVGEGTTISVFLPAAKQVG